MEKIALWLGLSVAGAVLGRLGGKEGFDTKFRDIGTSLCICLILGVLRGKFQLSWVNLSLIPTFLLQFGALTTYRYILPKPKDYNWAFYTFHGFMVALAAICFVWVTGHWFWFWGRCVICALVCGLWYFIAKWNDDLHEGGRYFFISVSTPLLLL